MRILITGGTGLIGRHLCKALLVEGHYLTVLSRRPETVEAKCGANVRAMRALEEWHPELAFDAVINLAGEPIVDKAWTAKRKQALRDSRIALTETLVRCIAAAKQKPVVLLSGSAVGYYGNGGDTGLEEDAGAGSDFAAELCRDWEAAAIAAENYGLRPRRGGAEPSGAGVAASHLLPQTAGFASNVSEVRVCLLRTGLVLSESGGLLGRMLLPFRLGLGARLGSGRQWMSWVHIEDYVMMVLRLLENEQMSGPFNMTAPNPVTNAEFTRTLAHTLGRSARFVAPDPVLKLAMGERAALLLEGQRVLPGKLTAAGFKFQFPSLDAALDDVLNH